MSPRWPKRLSRLRRSPAFPNLPLASSESRHAALGGACRAPAGYRRHPSPVTGNMIALFARSPSIEDLGCRDAPAISMAKFAWGSGTSGLRVRASQRLRTSDFPFDRRCFPRPCAGRRPSCDVLPRVLAHDLGLVARRSSGRPRGRRRRDMDQSTLSPSARVSAEGWISRTACGEFSAPVDCFGRGCRVAGAQSENWSCGQDSSPVHCVCPRAWSEARSARCRA